MIERTYTVAEVAAALGESQRHVMEKCRLREWPHQRGSRGRVSFTERDYARVLELRAVPADEPEVPRLVFAPRARRRAS